MKHKHAVTDEPVLDLLARRWSPRAFAPEPVSEATLRVIFEAARWAPSAFNEQPWRYIVATQQQTEDFQRLVACLAAGNQSWAAHAPVLGIGFAKKTYTANNKTNRHGWHDLGLATAQLITQAMALDLYVHLMAGIDGDRIREVFGVPEDFDPVTGIAIGYLGDADQLPEALRERELAPRDRRPRADWLFAGTWDRARYD